ncbi:DNA-directed primase/polymerase protein-like isoform X1 [Hylaeus volcanicus]|uniref:DNA-directed primase/polymerase protein-like isoform X1 n=2 Tax=Hylaeus volcanicus TaxID=313075 RepID=UPI0023B79E9E|nr:DNA-directed primase/polymerase protein-like isoform X1 [Hylaeus volcanicus]
MNALNPISSKKFYGERGIKRKNFVSISPWIKVSRKMPSNILGPPNFWKEYEKQADALATAFKESNDVDMLSTFVYQNDNGYRKFVVAHPEIYWWHYVHRPAEKRCSYEIIPENRPCRLYLDLEYTIEMNPESDGTSMTKTLIDIFNAYFLMHWALPSNINNVLNLDSSTNEKFSRHIIFNIKNVAFKDNYHVGRFVKSICNDILDYILSKKEEHNILGSFDRAKLEQLIVQTKNDKKLFIDTSVYTKNRHFRIYKSTKWGKQSNLVISKDSKYIPSILYNDRELNIFLDSLISYFTSKKDLILLEYSENNVEAKHFKGQIQQYNFNKNSHSNCNSRYSVLDKYIRNLILPGKIRLCKHFTSAKILVYETSGYRYCENIGRCHKSNNVSLFVNLKSKTMYQRCYDEDCSGFQSEPKQLPEEVCFDIDEEGDMLVNCVTIIEDRTEY